MTMRLSTRGGRSDLFKHLGELTFQNHAYFEPFVDDGWVTICLACQFRRPSFDSSDTRWKFAQQHWSIYRK